MNITEKSKTTVKMKNNEESNSNATNLLMRLSILARNAWSLSKLSNSQHLSLNHLVANLLESKTCENQYVYSQNFLRNCSFGQSKYNSDSKKIFTPVPLRAVNPDFKNLIEKLYNSARSNGSSFACRNELDDKSKNIGNHQIDKGTISSYFLICPLIFSLKMHNFPLPKTSSVRIYLKLTSLWEI